MSMAIKGAEYISGTFTVPNDSGNRFTLQFGKTFSKYLFLIDATDETKEAIIASGANGNRAYAVFGAYPMPSINNEIPSLNETYCRINPNTMAVSTGYSTSMATPNADSIVMEAGNFVSGAQYVYQGCSYKYYIVSLDEM